MGRFVDGEKVIHRNRGIGIYRGESWEGETVYVDFGDGDERVTKSLVTKHIDQEQAYGTDCPRGGCET